MRNVNTNTVLNEHMNALQIKQALELALRSIENLEERLQTDALSGLMRRELFHQKFSQMQSNGGFYVLIDIDHFKQINDKKGHLFGDHVIAVMGRLILERCNLGLKNSQYLSARWGGEEFLVWSDASYAQVFAFAESLRDATEKLGFCTISLGLSSNLSDADKAVYQAKNAGRNCLRLVG